MKKIIKFLILIVIAIFISCIFACVPSQSLEYPREFKGLQTAASGQKYYDDLVREASYLCAWHGRMFFNQKPIIIDINIRIFYVFHKLQYTVPVGEEKWGYFEESPKHKAEFPETPFIITADKYKYYWVKRELNESWEDITKVWESFGLELKATQYSGDKYITSEVVKYGEEARWASVTSSGRTRYTPIETHYDKNNQMAYLLADCNDNARRPPRGSYVNIAFWKYLDNPSTGSNNPYGNGGVPPSPTSTSSTSVVTNSLQNISTTSASGLAIATNATDTTVLNIEDYIKKLKNGEQLTEDECTSIYAAVLASGDDVQAWEILDAINSYKSDSTNAEYLVDLLRKMENLTNTMTNKAGADEQGASLIQNAEDFKKMWDDINAAGGTYEDTIEDLTDINAVEVEYNATTQKYMIGPFNIKYMERYTNDYEKGGIILGGMAGDPILTVKEDAGEVTYSLSSGEWEFTYLAPRTDGIPRGTDPMYDNYPHSGETFYITLNYKDGRNAILGLKVFFRYMQAEAYWSKSKGEIEQVEWKANFGSGGCSEGRCDGGYNDGADNKDLAKCHDDNNKGGELHYHGSGDDHDMGRNHTNCSKYTAHYDCNHDCGKDDCSHECSNDDIGCDGYYTCDGHICKTYADPNHFLTYSGETQYGTPCEHGFYGCHYSKVFFHMNGQYVDLVEIQKIATCHWAWRRYFDAEKEIPWNIDITTGLAGDVWLDIDGQKESREDVEDGNWENGSEHGVDKVLVTIKLYQNGNEVGNAIAHNDRGDRISWPQCTGENGHYQVDRIEAPGIAGGSNCYYVAQFEYDGQVYESTVFLQNGGGDDTAQQYMDAFGQGYFGKSMAVERAPERRTFDETFSEIYGKSEMQGDNSTVGTSPGGDIKYTGKSETKDSTSMIKSEFVSAATEDHENMRNGWESTYDRYGIKAYTYYADGTGITEGSNIGDYQIYYPFDDEGRSYTSGDDIRYIMNKNRTGASGGKRYIDEYMLHINLGLKKRKETDISLLKDLYKMSVVVNEQEIVQNFNCLVESENENDTIKLKYNASFETLKEELEKRRANRETSVNNLGLFSTDVAYNATSRYANAIDKVQEIKSGTELRVFATYAIRIYNNSDTNDVQINELTDYYDDAYTVIDSEDMIGMKDDGIYAKIVNDDMKRTERLVATKPYYRILNTTEDYSDISWKPTKEENLKGIEKTGELTWSKSSANVNGMQKSTTESLKDVKLKVNEYIEIFTTYEIDYTGYQKISDPNNSSDDITQREVLYANDEKDNIAEISNYSTFYSERDVEIDGSPINFYKAYEEGQNSGKIDKDSAPNNIKTGDITNIANYEDDTCRALPLKISLEKNERDMYGYVFEDKRSKKESNGVKVNIGDGIYNGSDELIKNVKVSMYEVISLADINEQDIKLNDLEYYYQVPLKYYNIGASSTTGIATGENAIVTSETAINGKEGNYCIYGFLTGDYILRFDYGTQTDSNKTIYSVNEDGTEKAENKKIIKYNGQDYENTSFLSGIKYAEDGRNYSAINDKYLNLRTEDMKTADGRENGIKAVTQKDGSPQYSVARDNEARRMVVNAYSRTIENDRGEILRDRIDDNSQDNGKYVEATAMFAETPIMQIEINEPKKLNEDDTEYTEDGKQLEPIKTIDNGITSGDGNKKLNVTKQEYHIKNINLGLEERAKTDIRLEQYIESIFLMKEDEVIFSATLSEDGKVITDNKDNKHLDKLTYLTHIDADNSNQQGFYAISVEDDYLNGLSMKIDYRIKIINNSETDFTGELAKYYVAKDIIAKAKFSPTTEGYTRDIANLLEKNDEDEIGMATNATLKEILRLDQDSNATLDSLLSQQDKTRVGQENGISENDTLRPDIIVYGKYVGRFYYENEVDESRKTYIIKQYKWSDREDIEISYQSDKVVKTTVDQLINYIDPNASYDLSTQNYENCAWDLSGTLKNTGTRKTIPSLDAIVSESSYRTIVDNENVKKSNIYDRKGNALVTDVSSNIVVTKNNKMTKFDTLSGAEPQGTDTYLVEKLNENWVEYRDDYKTVKSKDNRALTIELEPQGYDSTEKKTESRVEMWLMTTKTTASDTDANNMKFDNLVEVLVYSNPTGRRDVYSVPGNAMALATQEDVGFWKAGYNSKKWWSAYKGAPSDDVEFAELAAEKWHIYPEDDTYAPEFVTIIAPTGITLREYTKNVIIPIAILITIILIMLGVFGVKQIKIIKKRKADK